MPSVAVKIPAMGEGLQEARLVTMLKKPGETVMRDEPLYEMETDKAVMAVESPVEGVVEKWLHEEGTVLPIGAELVLVNTTDDVAAAAPVTRETPPEPVVAVPSGGQRQASGNLAIPPRTRAYAKEKGISDDALATISAQGSKLMPEDIDAYVTGGEKTISSDKYVQEPLPKRQTTLSYRMRRGADLVIPGTIERPVNWSGIEAVRQRYKDQGGEFQPSQYTIFAYGVAQAAKNHPKFRSILPNENDIRTYHHINLGTAVALPGDELLTAVVMEADALDFVGFAGAMREVVEKARQGQDQVSESTQLTITNMAGYNLRSAVPVLVSPAVAVLFMGVTYDMPIPKDGGFDFQRTVNLGLTFDHRLINGVGAAEFLNEIIERTESVQTTL